MTTVTWDPSAREFLRKLPRQDAARIVRKIEEEVRHNPQHYLERLVNTTLHKIRIGHFRLFVDDAVNV